MYTERVPILIGFSAFLLLTSIALTDWRPLILLLPLASLFFVANNLFPSSEMNVEVTREVTPVRITAGGSATVNLEIVNKGKQNLDFLEVYDKLPAEIAIKRGTNHLVLTLDPQEKVMVTYEILCAHRGRYEVGPTYLRTRDPLGFHFAEETLTASNVLYVLPEIERLRPTDLKIRHTGPWPGIFHSRRSGVGTEFYGLRRYVPGDELKRVDWKASARMARLITIEHESERSTDIIIMLDTGRGSNLGTPPRTPLEYGVKAAASLASLLLALGNRVGLIVHGKHRTWLPRDFGKRHFQKILNQLATAEAGGASVPIGYFGGPSFLPPKPQIILISPLLDPRIPDDVGNLAADGYNILIVSPSFLELIPPQTDESTEIAHRIMALERRNMIMELRRYGMVVDWNPKLPLRAALKEIKRWRVITRH